MAEYGGQIVIARAGVKGSPLADFESARKLQDGLVVSGQGKKPFTLTKYDQASLATLTDELKKEFAATIFSPSFVSAVTVKSASYACFYPYNSNRYCSVWSAFEQNCY